MKLVIDIPEEIYIEKKEDYIGDTLDRAIANGIPLEDIKTEIEDLTTYCSLDVYGKKYPVYDKKDVIEILDKHIKENK